MDARGLRALSLPLLCSLVLVALVNVRRGVQPVVTLAVNGGARANVRTGETVQFSGVIEAPPNTGKIVAAEWDFDGSGKFQEAETALVAAPRVQVSRTHTFSQPGTYFIVLRGIAQREGDASTPYARIRNIGRARVVVS
jgi:hypothetical protein